MGTGSWIQGSTRNLALSPSKGGPRTEPCFDRLSTRAECAAASRLLAMLYRGRDDRAP
jgi:hypothetical protein